jgi:hypothetical protein
LLRQFTSVADGDTSTAIGNIQYVPFPDRVWAKPTRPQKCVAVHFVVFQMT